ncbi:DUF5063 domain-containing protein [Thermodesulfobacteriota bacterium]
MVIDIEEDDDYQSIPWANIPDSEEYNFADKDEEYVDGIHYMEIYEGIVSELQDIAPHIRWRVTYDGTDSGSIYFGGKRQTQWRVICVPESQYDEAVNIFERYLKEDDLSNYSDKDKYPSLFVPIDGEKQLHPDIEKFSNLANDFIELIDSTQEQEYELKQLLVMFATLMPQIYAAAYKLPDVFKDIDGEKQSYYFGFFENRLKSNQSYEPLYIEGFEKLDEDLFREGRPRSLASQFCTIADDFLIGLETLQDETPDDIAAVVYFWRSGFYGSKYGWGIELLDALKKIHIAIGNM